MFSAAQAKKSSQEWLNNATKENKEWNRQRIAKEKREATAIWKTRGVELVATIDAHIEKQAAEGKHNTYMPSDINPSGDLVIWLKGEDRKIHHMLMDHYREQGYEVEEYSPFALKIEW